MRLLVILYGILATILCAIAVRGWPSPRERADTYAALLFWAGLVMLPFGGWTMGGIGFLLSGIGVMLAEHEDEIRSEVREMKKCAQSYTSRSSGRWGDSGPP